MAPTPETRHSLLLRLRDHTDQTAWAEFVAIYEPFVLAFVKRHGLQEADAREVCQDLMIRVARQVESWPGVREGGSFRRWLYRVSKNLVINYATRPKHRAQAAGGSGHVEALHNVADPAGDELDEIIESEYRRHLFHWAAQRVRPQFAETTWQAFWLTSVEGVPVAEVARRLGVDTGKVYVSRCRVMARLRDAVESWTQEVR